MELVDLVQERKCERVVDSRAGERRAVAFGRSSPLGWIKHFARLHFFNRDSLNTFPKLFQRREKVKLSIACHFAHLAYIFKKEAMEILISSS